MRIAAIGTRGGRRMANPDRLAHESAGGGDVLRFSTPALMWSRFVASSTCRM